MFSSKGSSSFHAEEISFTCPSRHVNIQCAYSVKENSPRGLFVTPRSNAIPPKYINLIYEFCSARHRHDVWTAAASESCSTTELVELNCFTKLNSKVWFRRRASALLLSNLEYQRTPNDHLPLKLLYRSPVKYIFYESLRVENYKDIYISSWKVNVVRMQRLISKSTEAHKSSSFPIGIKREKTINIAMCSSAWQKHDIWTGP